ncbi:SapB/AmfS family lanthipeptide [Streptomyces sp. CB03234]|nr:SapB/AmfS family lanthipeptide [Streptomyces sp. CB03234]
MTLLDLQGLDMPDAETAAHGSNSSASCRGGIAVRVKVGKLIKVRVRL